MVAFRHCQFHSHCRSKNIVFKATTTCFNLFKSCYFSVCTVKQILIIQYNRNVWVQMKLFQLFRLHLGNTQTYQDVEASRFEQCDLVGDGQPGETRHSLGKLHHLDDALGGKVTELVPKAQVQVDPVV